MPPVGTLRVDQQAVQLIHDWISQVPPSRKFVREWTVNDLRDDVALPDYIKNYRPPA